MNPYHGESVTSVQRRMLERWPWLRWLKPPSPTLNTGRLLARVLDTYMSGKHRILDLGCGDRRLDGAIRCDLSLKPPGIRADAAQLPFKSAIFDCVVSTAVLEHVPYPHRVVREIRRVLRPRGILYLEVPFLEGYHAHPDDYQRFTFRGLEVLLHRFDILDREVCVGPSSALSWMLRDYPAAWFGNPHLSLAVKWLAAWLTSPIRYLDYVVARSPGAFRIAAGIGVIARRPEGP